MEIKEIKPDPKPSEQDGTAGERRRVTRSN
jgi:hypothetical protein